ncbi:MAG TPA: hypothetical protein VGM79_30425 [Streptosporangiaceae bacterium]
MGGQAGVAVSWTTHSLLSLDWDRWSEYRGVQEAMNPALAGSWTCSGSACSVSGGEQELDEVVITGNQYPVLAAGPV